MVILIVWLLSHMAKNLIEHAIDLDISDLNQRGFFDWRKREKWSARHGECQPLASLFHIMTQSYDDGQFELEVTAERGEGSQRIQIGQTSCYFGGSRLWLVCECCRRVSRLFLGSQGFRCRTCYGLMYESQMRRKADE